MSHSIDMFKSLFGYNYWANGRLLQKAATLSEADYFEDQALGHGSLHNTLFHTLRTEQIWGTIIRTEAPPPPEVRLTPNQIPTLEQLQTRWQVEERLMLRYLDQMQAEALDAKIELIDPATQEVTPMITWRMLQHMLFHSMQHRSEAAQLLTFYGASPGDLDFINY